MIEEEFKPLATDKNKKNALNPFKKATDDDKDRPRRQDSTSSVESNGDVFDSQSSSIVSKGSRKKSKKDVKKEGYLLKKKSKTLFGISQYTKRFAVLENEKLVLYEDHSLKSARKNIDMSKVKSVCFHYDQNAPVKSKKMSKREKDESRFDIYTPHRIYMMKTDGNSLIEAESWVRQLKQAAQRFNPSYGS